MNSLKLTYALALTGAAVWCGLVLLAPYFAAQQHPAAAGLYQAFHTICHQLPERSFHLLGEKWGVCARCSSIYFAFLAGTLLYPVATRRFDFRRLSTVHPRWLIATVVLPMVLDVVADFVGLHESTLVTRTITGIMFGAAMPFVLLPVASEAICQLSVQHHSPSPITKKGSP